MDFIYLYEIKKPLAITLIGAQRRLRGRDNGAM
jgi:hypothetical protein